MKKLAGFDAHEAEMGEFAHSSAFFNQRHLADFNHSAVPTTLVVMQNATTAKDTAAVQ